MLGSAQAQFEAVGLGPELLDRLMASGFPDAICFKDVRRRVICLNEAQCQILGVASPSEVVGKTVDRLVAGRRARLWRQEDTSVLVSGEPIIDRIESVVEEDGTLKWLSATKGPIRNRDGSIAGLAEFTRDITEEKHREQLKDQFIATLSHELRTPVTAIMGSLSLMASGKAGTVPETAARLLKIASTNGERLVRLLNDILDLEKLNCGMMTFDLQPVDVRPMVEQEVGAIQSFAGPYGVRVRIEDDAEHATVRADPVRLAQAFSNLLSNAVKFSPRGAEVLVTIKNRGESVRISVRDHGPGVPAEFRDRLFQRFVQARDGASALRTGSGLGLSIVKQIVGKLHGSVSYEPAPDGGSVFALTLPRCEDKPVSRDIPRRRQKE